MVLQNYKNYSSFILKWPERPLTQKDLGFNSGLERKKGREGGMHGQMDGCYGRASFSVNLQLPLRLNLECNNTISMIFPNALYLFLAEIFLIHSTHYHIDQSILWVP